ncbi:MAG: phenylalanine--tRNA ligase subunit beta [Deltaproteobacteria bacterium]|nr:phenylalanine--tRNA ligase subunit beta [Deltaproteobacteria bacterium]
MKFSLRWLGEYVDIEDVPVEHLASRLTNAGLEVESIETIGEFWDRDKVLIGEMVEVRPHPNADRLCLATVNYGREEPITVVCGAPNALVYRDRVMDRLPRVALALEGARLIDAYNEERPLTVLKPATIRGVRSHGMVCSERELGLGDAHEGIIYLPDDAPVGAPLQDYLGDALIEFDIKGGFGHLQCAYGIARELAALLDRPLKRDIFGVLKRNPPREIAINTQFLELAIDDPDLCARYTGFLIEGVKIGPAPFWMQRRLTMYGMRPINVIVDITNYVMLEMGQPLHAFDYWKLRARPGGDKPAIIVRRARPGETIQTLDGVERLLDKEMLLITDGGGPVAVAGVMGGLESEVNEKTTDILLESANFNFLNIRRTTQMLKLPSEASARFGKGIDPDLAIHAGARAAYLMAQLAGGKVHPSVGDIYPGRREHTVLELSSREVSRILGVDIPVQESIRILRSLEFAVEQEREGTLRVSVPGHRLDVTRPVDLVEEIGRIWGYDRMPSTLMQDELPPQRRNLRLEGREALRDLLAGCGLDEVITYSLINIQDECRLIPGNPAPDPRQYVAVRNPLSAERVHLRRTLLPGLIHTARENLRFTERVAIFEIGSVYWPRHGERLPDEPFHLGLLMVGPRDVRTWLPSQHGHTMDFFDMKGLVETIVDRIGMAGAVWEKSTHPALHPGRAAQVSNDQGVGGHLGELSPAVSNAFDLPDRTVVVAEFNLELLLRHWGHAKPMARFSNQPPIFEDLAVVVDAAVPAARVVQGIREAGGELLQKIELFDMYRGPQLEKGRKSLAFALTYQSMDRTLKDEEAAQIRQRILRHLEKELGAVLRGPGVAPPR